MSVAREREAHFVAQSQALQAATWDHLAYAQEQLVLAEQQLARLRSARDHAISGLLDAGVTQVQIAGRMGLSRPTVVRAAERAAGDR